MSEQHHDPRFTALESIFSKYLEPLFEELKAISKINNPNGSVGIDVFSWPNPGFGHIGGWVSIAPNNLAEEESIDANISIFFDKETPNYSRLEITISWSDGAIISNLLSEIVSYDTLDDLPSKIDSLISQVYASFSEQMRGLAQQKLPARFRPD